MSQVLVKRGLKCNQERSGSWKKNGQKFNHECQGIIKFSIEGQEDSKKFNFSSVGKKSALKFNQEC